MLLGTQAAGQIVTGATVGATLVAAQNEMVAQNVVDFRNGQPNARRGTTRDCPCGR